MTVKYEIEYVKLTDGSYKFENISDFDYFFNDYNILIVEFEGYPKWENDGIGSYEYWGFREYDHGHDYLSFESADDPTWNESKHTQEENNIIQEFMNTIGYDIICKKLCDKEFEEGKHCNECGD